MSATEELSDATLTERALTVSAGIGRRDAALATRFVDRDHFIQHNLQCADGVAGLEDFVSALDPARCGRVQ